MFKNMLMIIDRRRKRGQLVKSIDSILNNKISMLEFMDKLYDLGLTNVVDAEYSLCRTVFHEGVLLQINCDKIRKYTCYIKIKSNPNLEVLVEDCRYPSVVNGKWVIVWRNGQWEKEGPWESHIRNVIEHFINKSNQITIERAEEEIKNRKVRELKEKEEDLAFRKAWEEYLK